ncbi:hypothetical protein NLJ89_g7519 [Agrocybe chaxingu]|uniref:F-box domain-containing protein n=1 Tax=Agrocybe chaxingu TaxID=84603 RepID=A0A9W8K4B5_9AGAR|nr:hypothetical protein NLJ89_g7519 [Agrocybe chaxingu]
MPPVKKTEYRYIADYSEECQDRIQVHENPWPKLEDDTSAVRRAPIEMLSEIFEYLIPSNSSSGDLPSKRSDAPTSLMLTCRAWNNAVFATPGFWTTIPTIEIPWKDVAGPVPPHPAVLLIVSESARWRRATISINAMSVSLLSGIKGRIPLLRTLRFSIQIRPSLRNMQEVFQTAPALVDLEVRTSRAFEFVDIPRTFTRFRGLVKDLQFFETSCAHITAITLKGPLQRIALPSQALTLPHLLSLSLINERFPYPADSANRSILSFLSRPSPTSARDPWQAPQCQFYFNGVRALSIEILDEIPYFSNPAIPFNGHQHIGKCVDPHSCDVTGPQDLFHASPEKRVIPPLAVECCAKVTTSVDQGKCFEAQEQGECSWKEMLSHPEGVEESKKLTGWHRVIAKQFLIRDPKESVRRSYALTGKRRSWVKAQTDDMNRLDIFLKHIESYEIVDVNSLNTSRLHRSMRDLSLIPDGIILQDDVYHFRKRAKALVKKWFDLLSPLVNERQWIVTENAAELEYVGGIPADKRGTRIRKLLAPDVHLTDLLFSLLAD